jgi:hypothetical protein
MERAAFLIEATRERITCLLNPEHVVVHRLTGLRPRYAASGQLTGSYLSDDPLLYTGGGRTEILMNLLFDISLVGSSVVSDDVRGLTQPLWNLAENQGQRSQAPYYAQPPQVRFVWGKVWNIPAVIAAVSERLEYFSASGVPQRSWLRIRLLRTDENTPAARTDTGGVRAPDVIVPILNSRDTIVHEVLGTEDESERLDEIAQRYYGDPSLWRAIAQANELLSPLNLAVGTLLRIPPLDELP